MEEVTFHPSSHPGWKCAREISDLAYPAFMYHDPVANDRFPMVYHLYPDWQQLAMVGDRVIGFLNCVPMPWNPGSDLPDGGWDWAISAATDTLVTHTETACALQVVVDPDLYGRGYSKLLVGRMRDVAASKGCVRLLAPVRPTRKSEFPAVSMAEYAARANEDGSPFDPWIRVHVSLGAKIIGPCERAMTITGTIAEWESWTHMRFPTAGSYEVPGALAPVEIDVEADRGSYVEPNLWVVHELV
jgi:GNAT superfamily N-acetyltransferase